MDLILTGCSCSKLCLHRYMYWTDWGENSRIEKASMDGLETSRSTIVSSRLGWPNGLAIDHDANKLYWADAQTEVIEYSNLDGSGRTKLVSNVPHPYGLTLLDDKIYWTDWEERSVQMAQKSDGSGRTTIRTNLPGLMDIHAVDTSKTTFSHPCSEMSCSHLCLPQATSSGAIGVCKCPTGITATGDTCPQYPNEFLVFCARTSVRRISLEAPDHSDVVLVNYLRNAISVDFHWARKLIFWSDVASDMIMASDFDGSNQEEFIKGNISTPDGIAVDWIANNIYWTDTGTDKIEVAKLTGKYRKVIISSGLDEPRALCLFPKKGLMYWSDWGNVPKIEVAGMDGSYRQTIVKSGLGWPNSLALDYEGKQLFWADAQLNRIETSDLLGGHRKTIISDTPHPFGLAVYGQYVYWTDWQTRSVSRALSTNGSNEEALQDNIQGLMDITAVSKARQTGSNPCSKNNGGCSYLCLARPSDPSAITRGTPVAVCRCPDNADKACVATGTVVTAGPLSISASSRATSSVPTQKTRKTSARTSGQVSSNTPKDTTTTTTTTK
jgi:sugar lactone lactonase YvrE